ncbi:hypothetical protein BC830DRAFT_217961 [Chytriomyces sp. MP71]|nr:hypothetical protein BC830DRAFT_217961 [Chytriomyces sp. MP71]
MGHGTAACVDSNAGSATGPGSGTGPTAWSGNTGSCNGKADNTIACLAHEFGICAAGVFANGATQCCPAGLVCCENLNRCDYSCDSSNYVTPPAVTPVYTPPSTCSACPDEYWVATSDGKGYYTCHGGQPKQSSPLTCDVPGMVPCPNLNRCDWPGCQAYNPPSNACENEADNAVVCTSTLTYNICQSGLIAASADQMCTGGTVCCQNLGRCDWPGCGGGSTYIPVPGAPAQTSYTPSCAGKADGDITCIDATTIQYCQNGQLIPNTATQSCAPGTVCCENMPNSCGWPGCAYPCPNSTITPIGGGGYGGSQPFLYTHGPKPDFCDVQANDWSHQGKPNLL